MSIAPFVLALLRYAVDVDRGEAGAPEEIVLRDRVLLGLGAVWALLWRSGSPPTNPSWPERPGVRG